MARSRVKWDGDAAIAAVRKKAAIQLDRAAGEVKSQVKTLLNVSGSAKRTEAGRRARKWVEISKAGIDDLTQSRRIKKTYTLNRKKGTLKGKTLVWSGKMTKLRKGAKVLGAQRAAKGEPPRKQTGRLHASIRTIGRTRLSRRVGTRVFYGKILEKTHPFLLPGLANSQPRIAELFGGN
jgi:hypothetical protein